jgi:hypothetical protein
MKFLDVIFVGGFITFVIGIIVYMEYNTYKLLESIDKMIDIIKHPEKYEDDSPKE